MSRNYVRFFCTCLTQGGEERILIYCDRRIRDSTPVVYTDFYIPFSKKMETEIKIVSKKMILLGFIYQKTQFIKSIKLFYLVNWDKEEDRFLLHTPQVDYGKVRLSSFKKKNYNLFKVWRFWIELYFVHVSLI